jgi:hypothetical protein
LRESLWSQTAETEQTGSEEENEEGGKKCMRIVWKLSSVV